MKEEFQEVPSNVITGKDLDYLSDMFQWNYGALKNTHVALNQVSDQEISDLLDKAVTLFDDNLNVVLDILENPGGDSDE